MRKEKNNNNKNDLNEPENNQFLISCKMHHSIAIYFYY